MHDDSTRPSTIIYIAVEEVSRGDDRHCTARRIYHRGAIRYEDELTEDVRAKRTKSTRFITTCCDDKAVLYDAL